MKNEMKILTTLLCSTLALCEIPPPAYSQKNFRPSAQLIASQPLNPLDVEVPSMLTIEQLIRLTEQLQSSRQRIVNNTPQQISSYLPPPRQPQQSYGPPNKLQVSPLRPPQILSGAPFRPSQISLPNNQYGPPQSSNFGASSSQQQVGIPQTTYGVPNNIPQSGSSNNNNQIRPPSTKYGVPDLKNIETFGEQRDLSKQQLPYKPPTGFRSPGESGQNVQPQFQQSINQQNLALSETSKEQTQNIGASPSDFGSRGPNDARVGQNYLPPSTTARNSIPFTRPTAPKYPADATTPASVDGSTNYDYDYDLQPTTEPTSNQDGLGTAGPNISISNAVAGAGTFFYLQQPDGRLQRVVLQKTQEPNSKPGGYVANYYFQNIQSLPDEMYMPLITLGSYTQK